jgi:hypothetical protein
MAEATMSEESRVRYLELAPAWLSEALFLSRLSKRTRNVLANLTSAVIFRRS